MCKYCNVYASFVFLCRNYTQIRTYPLFLLTSSLKWSPCPTLSVCMNVYVQILVSLLNNKLPLENSCYYSASFCDIEEEIHKERGNTY